MKLCAVLACRNESSRLYAKPLQYLDIEKKISILDFLIEQIKKQDLIDDIVLAISEEKENIMYEDVAKKHNINYVLGSDNDVLQRLIMGAEKVNATHVFRVTTESPFPCFNELADVYKQHLKEEMDFSVISGVPDGAFYEIIRLDALKKSWDQGDKKHRSELCTLYISENKNQFKISSYKSDPSFCADDIRLTVDWPEDLIVMREIYKQLNLSCNQSFEFKDIIDFMKNNPKLNSINNWIDSGIGRVWY